MLKKTLMSALCITGLLQMQTAYALCTQTGNDTIDITGTAEPGKTVTVEVFPKGKSGADLDSLESDEYLDILVYHGQTTASADGSWAFRFRMSSESGEYTAYTYTEGDASVNTEDFRYVDTEEFKETVNRINKAGSAEQVHAIIRENRDILGFSDCSQDGIDEAEAAKILYYTKEAEAIKTDDREYVTAIWQKCILVQKILQGTCDNVFDDEALWTDSLSDIKSICSKSYATDSLKKLVTSETKKLMPKGLQEFDSVLTERFVLAVIETPDGIANLKEVLDMFADEIGITPSSSLSPYEAVYGKHFDSFADLKKAFSSSGNSSVKPGGSVGGGGGGGGSSKISVPSRNTEDNTQSTIPRDIFDDTDSVPWARESIIKLAEAGIVSGKGGFKFSPNDNVKREEFVKIISLAFLNDADSAAITFDDVKADDWFFPYVSKAFGSGVITGYGASKFGTGDYITRQDLCVMAYKAKLMSDKSFEFKYKESDEMPFGDRESVSDYAYSAVKTLWQNGIINGRSAEIFDPHGNATRAEAAKIIYSLMLLD